MRSVSSAAECPATSQCVRRIDSSRQPVQPIDWMAAGDTLHWRMRAAWLGRLAIAAVSLASILSCAPGSQDTTVQPRANETPSDDPGQTNPTLRRTAPLSLEDRAAWRAVLDWPASCEEAFESSHAGQDGGLVIQALVPHVSLVEVLCAAGTYQPSHVYVRYDEQAETPSATLLEFPVFLSADEATPETSLETEIWGESSLSSDGRTLSVLAFSRQMADCGVWSRYAIDAGRPRLVAAAAKLPCPGTPGPPAESPDGDAPEGWRPLPVSQ